MTVESESGADCEGGTAALDVRTEKEGVSSLLARSCAAAARRATRSSGVGFAFALLAFLEMLRALVGESIALGSVVNILSWCCGTLEVLWWTVLVHEEFSRRLLRLLRDLGSDLYPGREARSRHEGVWDLVGCDVLLELWREGEGKTTVTGC